MEKKIKKLIFCLTIIFCVFCEAVPTSQMIVKADEVKTVRVAAWNRGGRFEKEKDGTLSGYDADLIEKVAEKCNFEVEYVWVSGPAEALEKLDNNELDIVTTMVRTDEREEKYLFSSNCTGTTYSGMLTLASRDDIGYEDIATISDCVIGYEGKSGRVGTTTAYLENMYGVTDEIPYDSIDEMRTALLNGDIDIMVTGANNVNEQEKIVDLFAPQEVYYLARQNEAELMNQINDAYSNLCINDAAFISNLGQTYFPMYQETQYTQAELDYIAEHQTIKVGIPVERKPICYYDEKTEKYAGIVIDIMDLLEENTGLKFEYSQLEEGLSMEEALADDRYDLILPTVSEANYSGEEPAYFSNSFLDASVTIAVRENRSDKLGTDITVGIDRDIVGIGECFTEKYPDAKIVVYDSQKDALNALKSGKVDAVINNAYVWSYLLKSPQYDEITIMPTVSTSVPYCIGGAKNNSDSTLFTIINKGISKIKTSDVDAIITSYTLEQSYDYTLTDYIYLNRGWIFLTACILALSAIMAAIRLKYLKKLEVSNEQLKRANHAKNMFLSRMSHEIRTPMNAILGTATLALERKNLPEQCRKDFEKVQSSGEYLMGIMNDILDMNQMESDQIKLQKKYVDRIAFLHSIEEMIRPYAKKEQITLSTDFTKAMDGDILIDKLRSEQVYINLLNNAVKFSDKGKNIEWCIEDELIDESHLKTTCRIKDYGCGMSEEFQKHMFEPFAKEHNQYRDTLPGSGLGLAIVHNLVEQMDGTIEVDSACDAGTEFIITVVRLYQKKEQKENLEANQRKQPSAVENLVGKKVLLVEDHPLNIEILKKILGKWKLDVDVAENGQIAVDKVTASEEFYYNVILMDISMPVMDGLEATRTIRGLDRKDAKQVPIVAVTANVLEEDIKNAMESGMDAYLAKPIDPKRLCEKLLKYCG